MYDGAHVENNCTDISKIQWSMNAAVLIEGAAFMYNFVGPLSPSPDMFVFESGQ